LPVSVVARAAAAGHAHTKQKHHQPNLSQLNPIKIIMLRPNTIRLAMPVNAGRLHDHFGGSREFALVDLDLNEQTVYATTIVPAPPHQPGLFPRWLRQLGVNTVVAGGIGKRAIELFTRHNITVRAGRTGHAH
jgi:predicted Fe-Mo cluster-binding NifX family protein